MKRMVDNAERLEKIAKNVIYDPETNSIDIKGKLQVNSSISSAYNTESSIAINENPQEGLTLSLVDGVNFVKEKDDLIEVHAYVQMTKTSGSYSYFEGLSISNSLVPSHNHTYLVPYGTIWGQVSGYMHARIDATGTIRLGDWSGIADGTRYIYLDFLYFRH